MLQQKIKILYVQALPGGGSLVALRSMLQHLDLARIEPVVLCYHRNTHNAELQSIPGCRVVYLDITEQPLQPVQQKSRILNVVLLQLMQWKKYRKDRAVADRIVQIIREEKPHIIHHNNDILINRQAVRAASKQHIPQVMHHRSFSSYGHYYINKYLDRKLMKSIAVNIYITKAVADHFNRLHHITATKCFVQHDLVDTSVFAPGPKNIALLNTFNIPSNHFVIASVGRLIPWKGQDMLLKALEILKDRIKDCTVIIAGTSEAGIGSEAYAASLREQAKQLQQHIVFAGDRKDVADILRVADVVVHTAVKPEPQGLVIIESLLCNITTIASNTGGSAELVTEYGGISWHTEHSAAGLAEKISLVYAAWQKDQMPAHSINRQKLLHDFDAAFQRNVWMQLYEKCLANAN